MIQLSCSASCTARGMTGMEIEHSEIVIAQLAKEF
jgi:hypothetical protein